MRSKHILIVIDWCRTLFDTGKKPYWICVCVFDENKKVANEI